MAKLKQTFAENSSGSVLQINDLHVSYYTADGAVKAVSGVYLTLERGERVALVGESGCGKTTLALSIMRLLRPPARIVQRRDLPRRPRSAQVERGGDASGTSG